MSTMIRKARLMAILYATGLQIIVNGGESSEKAIEGPAEFRAHYPAAPHSDPAFTQQVIDITAIEQIRSIMGNIHTLIGKNIRDKSSWHNLMHELYGESADQYNLPTNIADGMAIVAQALTNVIRKVSLQQDALSLIDDPGKTSDLMGMLISLNNKLTQLQDAGVISCMDSKQEERKDERLNDMVENISDIEDALAVIQDLIVEQKGLQIKTATSIDALTKAFSTTNEEIGKQNKLLPIIDEKIDNVLEGIDDISETVSLTHSTVISIDDKLDEMSENNEKCCQKIIKLVENIEKNTTERSSCVENFSDTLRNTKDHHQETLDQVKTKVDSGIDTCIGKLATLEGQAYGQDRLLADLDNKVDENSDEIDGLNQEITQIHSIVIEIDDKVDELTDITEKNFEKVENCCSDVKTIVTTIDKNVDTANEKLDSIVEDLDDIKQEVSCTHSIVVEIDDKVDELTDITEKNFQDVKACCGKVLKTVDGIDEKVDVIEEDVQEVKEEVTEIHSIVVEIDDKVDNLTSKVDECCEEVNGKLDNIETTVEKIEDYTWTTRSKVFVMNSEILVLDDKLDCVSDQICCLGQDIDGLSDQITTAQDNIIQKIDACCLTTNSNIDQCCSGINYKLDNLGDPSNTINCDYISTLTSCDQINSTNNLNVYQLLKLILLKLK